MISGMIFDIIIDMIIIDIITIDIITIYFNNDY